ncbi:CoA-phosphotransacetylase, similar to propanediol FT utilization protein PduL [Candidatus Phytoplasma mali]|uniref:Phosphate propanoyltransferase n=1 Tax=Phytoplasma mali (strain AT) TaxID=482235 RepID=B3QZM4_PHYMT|nr:phosphate propanoyltransferase [Candidatus Phytoplasma mali]CAP18411.1 CoA-phosphotransacetylase, similar to propanediol FT utilization protein PduL [Candidatus Phytoplasma mali]
MNYQIPVGISGRHVHLSQNTLDILFGEKNYQLKKFKDLKQLGQYASTDKINILSPNGQILTGVRVLGPTRNLNQVEISKSDALRFGFVAPVRNSGDIKKSGSATLIGPKGQIDIEEGVIIADRHIHLSKEYAEKFQIQDKQKVKIKINGIKPGILENITCRVDKDFILECHLDTDDACAFLLQNNDIVELII